MDNNNNNILPLCDWTRNVATSDRLEHDKINKSRLINIRPLSDAFTNWSMLTKELDTASSNGKRNGKQKLNDLIDSLNKLDTWFKRSNGQRLFHKAYIGACLKKIYGKDLYKDLAELLREYELDELRTDVIVTTPRRFGKTFGTALFVCAFLCTQGGMEVAIYSTGRRASRKMLALIYKLIVQLMGTESCIQSFNEEKLTVKGFTGELSTCFSYPSKVQIRIFLFFIYIIYAHWEGRENEQKKNGK
jgi:hypothetical protein